MEALSASQVIAALIAAALYVAAYLSFVRLLRNPRNWRPPSLPASLTTAGLAVVMASIVSLSLDGLDLAALLLLAGFVVALFYIIAAPAIAFRPTSRPVEFFAKHGEYAGLWMVGPAVIISISVPDIRLQAVLATAMTIELTWFLRQRWADGWRRSYSINDHDRSILETQAKGDLEAFRRRHGIRELVLSNGTISWRGCGKRTPPCPFNLYVNRLGLNTAPCCREHMKDLSHYVASCLSEMGVVHWLEGGSLLGAMRERGELLDWEDDIDISALLDGDTTWERLTAGLLERGERDGYYVDIFKNTGFISLYFDPPRRRPFRWERNRLRGEIRADIAIYRHTISYGEAVLERRRHKGTMPATEGGGYGVAQEIVLPTTTIPFLGGDFACPNQPEAYLRMLYGNFEEIEYTYVDGEPAKARRQIDTVDIRSVPSNTR
jgi:hypothetical protein